LDEATLAAYIVHPNVVSTLDVVVLGREIFLVMEYVRGETVARLLQVLGSRNDRIPIPIVGNVIAGVLMGLQCAHDARDEHDRPLGIVHRDVAPQNIMIGTDGIPRLLDFGVAKAFRKLHRTGDGQLKGKIGYMAPEQIDGRSVNAQSDLFSVAVVLWQMLTGQQLFTAASDADLVQAVLRTAVDPPSSCVAGISRELDAFVLKGLERDRAKRFTTARNMAFAFEQVCPIATQRQMSDWLEQIAGAQLAERAARVAEIERIALGAAQPELTHSLGLGGAGRASLAPPPPISVPPSGSYALSGLQGRTRDRSSKARLRRKVRRFLRKMRFGSLLAAALGGAMAVLVGFGAWALCSHPKAGPPPAPPSAAPPEPAASSSAAAASSSAAAASSSAAAASSSVRAPPGRSPPSGPARDRWRLRRK
jgi:eukaryotic-like serine/threonine-protein kinase